MEEQNNKTRKRQKKSKLYIWLPLIIGISIAAGILIGNSFSDKIAPTSLFTSKHNKFDNIIDYISKAYVDSINTEELIEKAIPTVISELDPHSAYISADVMAIKGDDLEGHFSGIGVQFMLFRDTITIVRVVDGGPSEAAGLKAGDRIVMVDDSTFVGVDINSNHVQRKLRGPKNSRVKLKIRRRGVAKLNDYVITRADVPSPTVDVSYILSKNIGYIKVSKFGSSTYNEFISAIAKLKSQGAESFIIDLQQNLGGYLGAAVMMTNEFLSGGELITYTEGRTSPRENIFADNTGTCKAEPLVVLIDEGSASSSEIFAGAIQDNDRGLIVGRRSFGKGLVQSQHVFKDGSALRLTIARYHTPSGRCIQKKYERGKSEEYSRDLLNRYMRGEFDSRDSIKLDSLPLFETLAGRPVYGDDGILADIFVPRDTLGLNSYYMKVANSGAINEYTFDFTDKYRAKLESFANWQEAAKFLESQPLVNQLVEYAEKNKEIRRRPYLIEESRSILAKQMEALIIRNVFGEEGFYNIFMKDDITLLKAIDLINKGLATKEAISKEKYIE